MGLIKRFLEMIATLQYKYPYWMLGILLVFTFFIALGVPSLEVQSDFSKESPRELPAFVLTDRISEEFGGETAVILLLEVEENDENELIDLREPDVVNFLINLENSLLEDSRVIKTSSIGSFFKENPPQSRGDIEYVLDNYEQLNSLFSEDYRISLLTITTNIGGAYEDIVPFEKMLSEKISAIGAPGGVKLTLTGGPPFGKVIRETIFSDAFYTMSIASVGIFLLLLVTQRSIKKSLIIFIPLIFALLWTGGILGFSGMKLSIASVALGSIVLGLGVEYGVFMLSRYVEERFKKKKSQLEANKAAVSNIGQALLGSGTTTIAGFLALTFSITPMMQKLGISLALGILGCILSAILVAPLLIIIEERLEYIFMEKGLDNKIKKRRFLREN